ncbi:uncharacterized protein LOC131660529 [Vicia villosa]|uniref:uncharacterized protein LOC131660529 n=1 Tax=Vicia villosa TaxID=3911 RepID=UPI00273B9BCE|nr:uncharacterized protein LOC131660529 [Vicia villosa]XP_058785765.1 uncharacterized protein LOC131660529 [Vicia villosa]XP_058785766.1 uncharacterized protein LOC131660529 [Vicia villosa]
MDSESGVPILDFRKSTGIILEEGGQGWKEMSKKVREALESHGMFLLRCDEIPKELQNKMFTGIKSLFDLPEETKTKSILAKELIGVIRPRTLPFLIVRHSVLMILLIQMRLEASLTSCGRKEIRISDLCL